MRILLRSLFFLLAPVLIYSAVNPDMNPMELSGDWQVLFDNEGNLNIETAATTVTGWKNIKVPHYKVEGFDEKVTKFLWFKREFSLTEKQVSYNSVIKLKQVFFGAVVIVNGKAVLKTPLTAPSQAKIKKGILKAGINVIYIRANGWEALPKTDAGKALVPAGSASFDWGDRSAKISDRVWLDFYDDIYISDFMLLPDLKNSNVLLKVWLEKEPSVKKAFLDIILRDKRTGKIRDITFEAVGENPIIVKVPIENPIPWEQDNPHLYTAEITARAEGNPKLYTSKFGMRDFLVKDGHFYLNGKRIILKGSELVYDWRRTEHDGAINALEYAVEQAKYYNFNCFRPHTLPPPESWLNMFDENGILVICEFPVTWNMTDFQFSKEEAKMFEANATKDALIRIKDLANHPSIVIWAPTNEPREVAFGWELKYLQPAMSELDKTRPILRTAALTDECRDIHPYTGFWNGPEGSYYKAVASFEAGRRSTYKNKAFLNTEYLEAYNPERQLRWSGKKKASQKDDVVYAEFCAEQTEALRRLDFDAMLPYWYSHWNNPRSNNQWRTDFLSPALAAFKSAFAPVYASLDLFNRNFGTGETLNTPVYYINDTEKEAEIEFNFYITDINPEYVPYSDAFLKPLYSATVLKTLKPYERLLQNFELKLPEKEGVYYFSVITNPKGMGPAISQREIHALGIQTNTVKNTITLCGISSPVEDYLKKTGIGYTKEYFDKISTNIILACTYREFQNEFSQKNQAFEEFFERGGKAVILEDEGSIIIKLPVEIKLSSDFSSRAFIAEGAEQSPLLKEIKEPYLWRWNNDEGVCYKNPVITKGLAKAKVEFKSILQAGKPEESVLLSIKYKKGELLINRLDMKKRITAGTPTYDPVAERIFRNLLAN